MEMEYSKKDIKKAPKVKSKDKFTYDDSGKHAVWKFEHNGESYAFVRKEDAEIAYKRIVG